MASTKDRKHSRASFQFEFQLLIPKAGFLVTMTNRSCKHSRNDCRCFKFGSTRKRWSENGSGTFRVALAFHPGDRQCQLSTYLSIYLPTYLPTYLPLLAVPFTQAAFDACGWGGRLLPCMVTYFYNQKTEWWRPAGILEGPDVLAWSSLVEGDEQLDQRNSQTTMELCHACVA